jgi:CBS domain containing-hemolysin-like protein
MSASLLLVPFLIALNAFFVAAEYALVAIRSVQLEQMRQRGWHRAAAAMEKLKASPASAIGAIQVCITLTNLLLGGLGEEPMRALLISIIGPLNEVLGEEVFSAIAVVFSFTLVTFLTVVFSELLPKALTLRFVPTVAIVTGGPVLVVLWITRPIVWAMNTTANLVTLPLGLGRVSDSERGWHTADEIRLIAAESAEHGELTSRERHLILNSLALGRRTARQIMVPRVKVAFLDLDKSMDDNRRVMNEHLYSRLPLCNGGIDHVIGIVPTREFLATFNAEGESSVLQLIARPAVFAPDTIPLDKLLVLFDEKRTQMVVLVDEHGGVEGIVTLRDVVDELVGRPIELTIAESARVGAKLVVPGEMPLHEFEQRLGHDLSSTSDSVTVGGLITEKLGRFPRRGDTIELAGHSLKVIDGDTRVVRKIEVTRNEPLPAEGE